MQEQNTGTASDTTALGSCCLVKRGLPCHSTLVGRDCPLVLSLFLFWINHKTMKNYVHPIICLGQKCFSHLLICTLLRKVRVKDDTYNRYAENHLAAETVENCPMCLGAALLMLHPCPPQRVRGTSPHAPPSSLTTTQKPSKCGRKTTDKEAMSFSLQHKMGSQSLTVQD